VQKESEFKDTTKRVVVLSESEVESNKLAKQVFIIIFVLLKIVGLHENNSDTGWKNCR
jgi:hypothetical protein